MHALLNDLEQQLAQSNTQIEHLKMSLESTKSKQSNPDFLKMMDSVGSAATSNQPVQ